MKNQDKPVVEEGRRLVIAETPTADLVTLHADLAEQLDWGLSKQARKAVEIKLKAIELTLAERKE